MSHSHTCPINPVQATALEAWLRDHHYDFRAVPYSKFSAAKENVNVTCYQSGKLVVQGKGASDFIEFVLEPEILKEARAGYEAVLNPEILLPRIGVDESGKGDFFGPLSIAGVYINEQVIKAWENLGIRDSKRIGSDKAIADFARKIRETPGCVTTVVTVGNEAYNRLYRSMKSVNTILAWGHARVIENLLGQKHRMNPPPARAISDQFAADKGTIANALMGLGKNIELVQRHKAESDLAVAAASILARDDFVSRLDKLSEKYQMELPKGASARVDAAGKIFIDRYGADALPVVAKTHFRTAARVQGLPEPPKIPWKRGRRAE